MSVNTYYLSKSKEGSFGSVFYLKQLQEAGSTGGGSNLLGSMVQWIDDHGPIGINIGGTDYAIPQSMGTPKAILTELTKQGEALGIPPGGETLQIKVASSKETVKMEKKAVFGLSVGPFPVIPFDFAFDVDYSKLKSITIVFGEGTYSEYIPMAYLSGLYQLLNGKPNAPMGGKLLEKNAIVHQVVLAKNYSVTFESSTDMTTSIDAKIKQFNALPEIGGKVKIQKKTSTTLVAEVKGDVFYVVAITASLWKNLK